MKRNVLIAFVIFWFVSCTEESTYEQVIAEDPVTDISEDSGTSEDGSNQEPGNTSDDSSGDV